MQLEAMNGRLVLRFPQAVEKIGSVYVADAYAMRPEIGELVSIGDPLNEDERVLRKEILDRAARGHKFIVPMATGTYYWRKEMGPEFEFLKDVRSYRISEIATSIAPSVAP